MVNALSNVSATQMMPYQSAPKLSKADKKFNEKVFHDCQKTVKKAEVRDADWGLYAAQTCLAKDLVSASPDQAKLIVAKMHFLQTLINQNMEQDQDIYTRENSDKCHLIITKADAKTKVLPARATVISASGNAVSSVIDSTAKLADSSTELVKTVKTPVIPKIDTQV
ncbi:hypothetical protein IJ182_09300 [bacterium]|nr:hypothetical protein [bacterium]